MSKQMPQKSRLGRGLSSLMNSTPADVSAASASAVSDAPVGATPMPGRRAAPLPGVRVLEVPLDQICRPTRTSPAGGSTRARFEELADSLQATGLIQPVVARGTRRGATS